MLNEAAGRPESPPALEVEALPVLDVVAAGEPPAPPAPPAPVAGEGDVLAVGPAEPLDLLELVEQVEQVEQVEPVEPVEQVEPVPLDVLPVDVFPASEGDEPLTVLPVEPPRKGWPVLAWTVVAVVVLAIAAPWELLQDMPVIGPRIKGVADRFRPVEEMASSDEDAGLTTAVSQIQARYLIGAEQLFSKLAPASAGQFYEQAQVLNTGPVLQRLQFVVVAGELAGPAEARKKLRELDDTLEHHPEVTTTAVQDDLRDALERLYEDYEDGHLAGPSLTPWERSLLTEKLGWLGRLALAPKGGPNPAERSELLSGAKRVTVSVLAAMGVGAVGSVLGLFGLVLLLVLASGGRVRGGIRGGSRHGGVYAETFALWMLAFVGVELAATVLISRFPALKEHGLLLAGAGSLLSLLTLAWPVLRGIPWRTVREEVGLTLGRRPLLEPVLGPATYVMSWPLLAVGLILVLILTALQNSLGLASCLGIVAQAGERFTAPHTPAHPIVEVLARGGWVVKLEVILLASVIAPFVEEIMFRGVLYRHLREATWRWGGFLSVAVSAGLMSFVFAVIHPQGIVAVPALMALAVGFTLAREWRGTLVPAMIAHGLNNALVTLLAITVLGG